MRSRIFPRPRFLMLICLVSVGVVGGSYWIPAIADDPAVTSDADGAAVDSGDTTAVGSSDATSPETTGDGKNATSGQAAPSGDQEVKFGRYNSLNAFERWVILQKGTERAGPGGYTLTKKPGTYICRRCNAKLYNSEHKFESHCGWPSFDDEFKGAVKRQPDADGYRVEIVCNNCDGHLGHVFEGERLTEKNVRHCVNSISMKFIPKGEPLPPMIKPLSEK